MPRQYRRTFTPSAADADGICASQTPAAGGEQSLTIGGALASGGAVTLGTAQHVTITAVGNESARTFTVTGTDRESQALTETITGPNATTAASSNNFATVTAVTVDDDTAGAVTVGVNGLFESGWYCANPRDHESSIGLAVDLNGSAAYTFTVQHTYDDIYASGFDETAAKTFNSADIAGATADAEGNYTAPISALRLAVTTETTAGSLDFTVLMEGR
jgi:hypothetical protein